MAAEGQQSQAAYRLWQEEPQPYSSPAQIGYSPPGHLRRPYASEQQQVSATGSPPSPSRQSTGGSLFCPSRQSTETTVASESDLVYPWGSRLALESRLEKVREQRGWKYFVLHRLRVPLAFGAGMGFGLVLAYAALVANHRGLVRGLIAEAKDQGFYPSVKPPKSVPDEYLMADPLNNSCLIPHLEPARGGPQTFDACGFVIRSTDEVWNLRGNVDESIEKYFHKDYYNAGSWGKRGIGKKELRDAILSEMRAFPDIQIHITDCVCKGNDIDGYKCAMPDVLTGTNLGPSAYGPATGRYARWTGMVESLVKRDPVSGQWQYVAEWGVHDEWALIQQLGLDFSRVPRPETNSEPLHDCTPLTVFEPAASMNRFDKSIQDQRIREQALHK